MPNENKKEIGLEIGHVLFIDIVGYSKLLITEQSERLQKLKEIVWGTEQFRQAQAEGKLLRLPTGDGGALVFRNHPEAPVLCAMEISKELKNHPELHVRMGIYDQGIEALHKSLAIRERLNDKSGKAERVGGIKWTIKDGIAYDAKKLAADVAQMVEKRKRGTRTTTSAQR